MTPSSLQSKAWFLRSMVLLACVVGSLSRAAPVNDAFAQRTLLTGLTNVIDSSNVGATVEVGEPEHAGLWSSQSVWWSWRAPVTGTMKLSTMGSSFDTVVGVYFGSVLTNLTEVVSDDDSGTNGTSVALFRAIAGESYEIAVAGFAGAQGIIKMRLESSGYASPDWFFLDLNDEPVSATTLQRNVIILDFFETTCGDCILETPDLLTFQRRHRLDGFQIVAVSKDPLSPTQVEINARELGIDYPVVINRLDIETRFGGPLPMPTKVVIDREGKVQMKITGGHSAAFYGSVLDPLIRGAARLDLRYQRANNRLSMSWPATEFGYSLEFSTRLSPNTWSALPGVQVVGSDNVLEVLMGSGIAFYRLHKPPP